MHKELDQLKITALNALKAVKTPKQLEEIEILFLGRKQGQLTTILKGLKDLAPEERKKNGEIANKIKIEIEQAILDKQEELKQKEWEENLSKEKIDITAPALPPFVSGHIHPISAVQKMLEDFFSSMGFMITDGPELESDYYNFTALNIPENHPARDMQDTFYIKNHSNWVMRTHTSPVQIRALQKYGAPLRVIVPGKCFRNEATDARHEHTFYQLEGLVVDKGINFTHLKGVLEAVFQFLYGKETKLRMRPKFYPFVEPGVNIEVTCFLCKGEGCRVCKHTGWLESGGAGMVHPYVLKEGGAEEGNTGFAFGVGLNRMVMLKYGITDVRLFESGDLRFLEQF